MSAGTAGGGYSRYLAVTALSAIALVFLAPRFLSQSTVRKLGLGHRLALPEWIAKARHRSFFNVIAAFGPDGEHAIGTGSGSMIASPSRHKPNYWYQWSRDGSLCLKVVLDRLMRYDKLSLAGDTAGFSDHDIERRIKDFVAMNIKLQHLENPSGDINTGGLGEPKFETNGTPFTGSWGRPQNDGPAIRASVAIQYATMLLERQRPGDLEYVDSKLYHSGVKVMPTGNIIKTDLEYIARVWKEPSFDLWEEVQASGERGAGGHFFTLMVQRRALLDGAAFAARTDIKDPGAADYYKKVAGEISLALENFWNADGVEGREGGPSDAQAARSEGTGDTSAIQSRVAHFDPRPHILVTLGRTKGQPKPAQVDTAVLLGVLHGYSEKDTDGQQWAPWSERSLSSLNRIVDCFHKLYDMNTKKRGHEGIAIGRYPEDSYDGVESSEGHPWFLCTFTVAQILYISAHHFMTVKRVELTGANLDLAQRFRDTKGLSEVELKPGKVLTGQEAEAFAKALAKWADAFLAIAQDYALPNCDMAEQYHRKTGEQRGAKVLTWSHAMLCTSSDARATLLER